MEELLRRTHRRADRAARSSRPTGCGGTSCDPQPARKRAAQSRDQCARRDAGRRHAHDRDRECATSTGVTRPLRDVAPGQYVCISVTDTGVGMTAERAGARLRSVLHHQADRAGHRARAVDGLRLRAPVRGPCRASIPRSGRGTTVKLYLPRYRGAVEDARGRRRGRRGRTARATARPCWWSRTRLSVRELVIEVLDDLGYRALEAADGPAGPADPALAARASICWSPTSGCRA